MKKKHLIAFATAILALNFSVVGNGQLNEGNSNYVVIGAFAIPSNASHFAESAKKLNFKAELAINPTRKLYYVYVLHTGNLNEAIEQAQKIRTETKFSDTWVYKGLLGDEAQKGTDVNPVTQQSLPVISPDDNTKAVEPTEEKIATPVVETPQTETAAPATEKKIENQLAAVPVEGAKSFIFKLISETGEELKGDVDVIDADRLSKTATYEANKQIYIKPVNKSGRMTLISQVFGYRKAQRDINYDMPDSSAGIAIDHGNIVVPFELTRLKKGDIAIMFNVFFFKDAAVMRPESRYEVTTLLNMMKENPKLKIKLHGHTNGNAAGKIIRMGEPMNFFSLTGSHDGFGSSKELSESRAEAIRDFLIFEGIDPTRFSVKAWGGKKPIHDKKSNKAHENVRVEVEILED